MVQPQLPEQPMVFLILSGGVSKIQLPTIQHILDKTPQIAEIEAEESLEREKYALRNTEELSKEANATNMI